MSQYIANQIPPKTFRCTSCCKIWEDFPGAFGKYFRAGCPDCHSLYFCEISKDVAKPSV